MGAAGDGGRAAVRGGLSVVRGPRSMAFPGGGLTAPGGVCQHPATSKGARSMLLTKHEGESFINQTVYISGQAFVRCTFVACTLILRETVYHLEGCTFERCNWHVDWVLMWGSPESLREIKSLVGLMEQAQQTQLPPDQLGAGTQQATESLVR